MGADLSVVIVNWHSKDDLGRCLESLLVNTSIGLEVLVIDAASYDGCEQMLREHYPQVRFIQARSNDGFARANNRAFEASTARTVLFLNPDTEVVGPAVDTMFQALRTLPNCGAVGGTLLNSDGTVQLSSIQAMPTILNRVMDSDLLKRLWPTCGLWGNAPLHDRRAGSREVDAISGACLMLARRVFEEVGRFSEDYFMYAEDVDLCHKVRAAGYRNYYVPTAAVTHHGGSSSGKSASTFAAVMMPEATLRFFRKTHGRAYAQAYRFAMCASALVRLTALALGTIPCRCGRQARDASVRKWLAVLRWSTGRDALVKKHYGAS